VKRTSYETRHYAVFSSLPPLAPLFRCPLLLFLYIRSYTSYLEAVSSVRIPRWRRGVVAGTCVALLKQLIEFFHGGSFPNAVRNLPCIAVTDFALWNHLYCVFSVRGWKIRHELQLHVVVVMCVLVGVPRCSDDRNILHDKESVMSINKERKSRRKSSFLFKKSL